MQRTFFSRAFRGPHSNFCHFKICLLSNLREIFPQEEQEEAKQISLRSSNEVYKKLGDFSQLAGVKLGFVSHADQAQLLKKVYCRSTGELLLPPFVAVLGIII
ncbi:hypothetical protein ATANTOWER_009362 [Ataeniobius toweri]|uniref:Uncharacterized protein n=1 Tax=Ataeniobius toweri TaxID=208326 RepID=A0ABU7BHN0_9TELE|nr:hypothetical protein [Ataeniobius toweri]